MCRKERMEQLLALELNPAFLQIINESDNHHVPKGSQTHFKIIAVSSKFNKLTRIARHRLINQLLANELEQGLHALSMHLYTVEEWEKQKNVLNSPFCKDGFKK